MSVRRLLAETTSYELQQWQAFLRARSDHLEDERKKARYDRDHGYD